MLNRQVHFLKEKKQKNIVGMKEIVAPLLLLFFLSFQHVHAEGTKQIQPLSTDPAAFLQIFDNNTTTRPFATYVGTAQSRLHIHISNIGEKIYYGFQQQAAVTDIYYRIKDPSGTVVVGPTLIASSAGPGYIASHAEAVAGPSAIAAGGYNALL